MPTRYSLHPIVPRVCRIRLDWSNCYALAAVGEENGPVWLIDTGLQSDRQSLLAALWQMKVDPARITGVVLTHGHCDHAGSAAHFSLQAPVYAHEDEVGYLDCSRTTYGSRRSGAPLPTMQALMFRGGEHIFPVERFAEVHAIRDGDLLPAPGGDLRVIHTPGHTLGHIALYRESDCLLFSGDAIINVVPHVLKRLRRVGLSMAPKLFTWNQQKAYESARKLVELKPEVMATGHGPAVIEDTAAKLEEWAEKITRSES